LFEHPYADETLLEAVGLEAHRELAREAVRKSLVLLKNENAALPIPKEGLTVYVAGQGAKDIGLQCGGWTIQWQGAPGAITPGTTILEGIQSAVAEGVTVEYNRNGQFDGTAEFGIVVVGEWPYAEGVGDTDDLSLSDTDLERINNIRASVDKLVVVVLSGRPMVITDQLPLADAWVAAWLPGTEGDGVADVLFGDYPFVGKLPYTWPRSNEQLPINIHNLGDKTGCDGPLFPFGYGLTTSDPSPEIAVCP
jgi:beta-glucosidase